MAFVNANVTSQKNVKIKTNIGDLQLNVMYLDADVYEGDYINVITTATAGYPYQRWRTVIGSPTNIFTSFLSDNGVIRGNVSNNQLTLGIYYDNSWHEKTRTNVNNNQCLLFGAYCYIGANGVAYITDTLQSVNTTGAYDIEYTPNTATTFGKFARVEYEGGASTTVQADQIKTATAILEGSNIDVTDPYAEDPNGYTETGGGTGNFDNTGDDIDFPSLPTLSAVDTGFISLFNPSLGQLKSLANYMWSGAFDLNSFKKIFADPMDCILGLSIVPVAVPNGGAVPVTVGNISTGVSMTTAARQYVEVDCGTLNVNEYWGAYLDYAPFTKCEIYLPYIGTHPLDVDDVMNKSVHVKYHVDILSGACSAYVKCGGSVMYEFIGQCSSSIPVSANDWTNVINGVLSIAGSIGSMVATGGASAPMAVTQIASTAVNSLKPSIEKSGSMSGTGGMLGVQTPYLILSRPRQALPKDQNKFLGYPSFINANLGSLTGYTEVEEVFLDNVPATDDEIQEIKNLLESGVIF